MLPSARRPVTFSPRVIALAALSAAVVFALYRIIAPLFPALTWAVALAVCTYPLSERLKRRIRFENVAAAIAVAAVAVAVVVPVGLASRRLAREAREFFVVAEEEVASGRFRQTLEKLPQSARWLPWLESQVGVLSATAPAEPEETAPPQPAAAPANGGAPLSQAASMLTSGVGSLVTGLLWLGGQLFVTFLALFFFLRDRRQIIDFVRDMAPFSRGETNQLLARIDDTIHATIYGSLAVAAIQGTMGGLIFWYLGLPSPLLWGAIMGLMAVVPVLGTFVIWAPTALYLAFQGRWTDALILASWGGIAIALVDNFIYPYLVGSRLRYHTLLVFVAMVGGLASFGASGIILGPLALATGDGLIRIWSKGGRERRAA